MKKLLLLSTSLTLLAGSAYSDEIQPLKPRIDIHGRYSHERSIGVTEIWFPISQTDTGVIYGDIRYMNDNIDNQEGNLGLGVREIYKNTPIGNGVLGTHVWFDRRVTDLGSVFPQITWGGEWLGEQFDALVNVYMPLSKGKYHTVVNENPQGPRLSGSTIVVDTDGISLEEPHHGFDLELGWEIGQDIPFLEKNTDAVRLYGGGYYFDSSYSDEIIGYRVRAAVDITSNLQIGARYQHDPERGSQTFLDATIRFPFGNKQSYRKSGLRARLDESPERDVDIVTETTVIDDGIAVPVKNETSGEIQSVIHVDNTAGAGGNGSLEKPYNSLSDAEAAATANSIIYVHYGDGTSNNVDTGITLSHDGMSLIGSGSDLVFEVGGYTAANGQTIRGAQSSVTLVEASENAVISNTDGNGVTVTASGVSISGITVDGASEIGISALSNSDNVTWDSFTLEDVTTINNGTFGIRIWGVSGGSIDGLTMNNVTANLNGSSGIYIAGAGANSHINSNKISNITASNNTQNGFYLLSHTSTGGASDGLQGLIVENSTFSNNGGNGINMSTFNSGTIQDLTFDNVTSSSNDGSGIFALSYSGSGTLLDNLTIKNSSFTDNDVYGVRYLNHGSATISNSLIDNTTISGNGNSGIYIRTYNDANFSAYVQNSVITNNTSYGIEVDDDTNLGSFNVDLGGGTLNSVGQNSIYNNTADDIFIDYDDLEMKAENNWWNDATGLQATNVTEEGTSSVDSTPFLTSAP